MATAAVQAKTHKPKPPDPQRVYELYCYEVEKRGQWGAFQRTADAYGKSNEWARKVVNKYKKQLEPLDTELAYVPVPGKLEDQQHTVHTDAALLRQLVVLDVPTPIEDMTPIVSVEEIQLQPEKLPTFQPTTLSNAPATRFPTSNQGDRYHLAIVLFVMLSGLVVIAAFVVLVPALWIMFLALLLPAYRLWWAVVGLWQVLSEA